MHLKFILGMLVFFLLSGCSADGLDEVYTVAGGTQEFRFNSDGTVVHSLMGNKVAEYKYEINGNEISIYTMGKTPTKWTMNKNGDLTGPAGVTMTVKK